MKVAFLFLLTYRYVFYKETVSLWHLNQQGAHTDYFLFWLWFFISSFQIGVFIDPFVPVHVQALFLTLGLGGVCLIFMQYSNDFEQL